MQGLRERARESERERKKEKRLLTLATATNTNTNDYGCEPISLYTLFHHSRRNPESEVWKDFVSSPKSTLRGSAGVMRERMSE